MSHVEKRPEENNQNSFDDVDNTESDDENDIDDENNIDSEDENNIATFLCFLKDHPLHYSHHVTLLDDMQGWVPNFVGGAIPRSDRGDREYYCYSMLTFL